MITPGMVMEVVACGPELAEHIAAYATHRVAGLLPTDARREVDIGMRVGAGYEKVLPELCDRFGLPMPRKAQRRYEVEDPHAAGVSGSHQTNHVQRGRSDPTCLLCQAADRASWLRVPPQTPPVRARTSERARAAGPQNRR